jgi:hypothetical protein
MMVDDTLPEFTPKSPIFFQFMDTNSDRCVQNSIQEEVVLILQHHQ